MTNKIKYIRDKRSPIPEKEITSKIMSAIKGKNTLPEKIFRKKLWNEGLIGYRLHKNNMPGNPDIIFSRKKVAIFVNGCFWHRCPYCKLSIPKSHKSYWKDKFIKNVDRDKKNYELLTNDGWLVCVVWECKIKRQLDLEVLRIRKMLNKNQFA